MENPSEVYTKLDENSKKVLSLVTPALNSLNQELVSTSVILNALLDVLVSKNVVDKDELQKRINELEEEIIKKAKDFAGQSANVSSSQQPEGKIITPEDIKKRTNH